MGLFGKFAIFNNCQFVVLNTNILREFPFDSCNTSHTHYVMLHKKIVIGLAEPLNYELSYHLNINETKKKNDLLIYIQKYNSVLLNGSDFARAHLIEDFRLAIPIGQEYNGYEKLHLPFDDHVWCLILLTFLFAFTTVFVLRYQRF